MTEEQPTEERPGTPPDEERSGEGPAEADLGAQLVEAQKAAEVLKDQLLRKAAEFENYKRRTEGEYLNLIKNANENLLSALLPVLDDLSRSLKAGKERPDFDVFYRGIELIESKLVRTLEGEGLKAFDSAGMPFDVAFHDALLMVPRADVPPHTVVEEVERGYLLNDRVLRHAKVIVSTEVPPDGSPENGGAGG